ncbi:MAG: LuxR C-terminal-related transcriptional regulator [Rubrobacteraceae bacterium]
MPRLQGKRSGGRHLRLAAPSGALSEEPHQELHLWMLGDFRVSVGPRAIEHDDWRLRKSASLLKLLALQPRYRMHREQVMDLLWPNLGARRASNNLHQTLHEARKTLRPAGRTSDYLRLQDEQLVFSPDVELWTDVDAFRAAAAVARNTREPAACRRALEAYGGELLPADRYEEWAEEPRQELQTLYLDLRTGLAAVYEERAEYRLSIELLEELAAEEPGREEIHAALMRLYALTGRRRKALVQYEQYERFVQFRGGDPKPDPEIEALYGRIRAGSFPSVENPPLRPSRPETTHPNNLPVPRTNFIGREKEISEVKNLLERSRLLTLTGVGGSGKTRLALETARELLDRHPGGVWMVGLSSISDPDLVTRAAAQALAVREQPHRPLEETLPAALGEKNLLILLDNCEHVVGAAAKLAEMLLDSCPRLRILATSRELLGIESEVNWTVPPMSLPGSNDELLVEDLQEAESARLFADRASRRLTSFSLTPENAESVAEICRKLDGIPLAIELAAARVGTLSVGQISERLENALRLLTNGRRTAGHRQRTLRGTLDWSHDLLEEQERQVFRRLSVFAGGFTPEAAEKVTSLDGTPEDRVLDLLSGLVDKSLVVSRDGRYRLLEPVRQYAGQKLEESGAREPVSRRHALWCLELAEEAEPELTGPDQTWWVDRLETEHDNLRAALGWALDGADPELGLRLAGLLWLFWHTHGHSTEGRRWLELGIKEAGDRNARLKAKALNGAGWISIFQHDFEMSELFLKEGAALYRKVGDPEGLGACLSNIWFGALLANREVEEYRWCMEEIEAIKSRLTHNRTLANITFIQAIVELRNKELEEARSSYRDARILYEKAGDAQGTAMVLFNLAVEALLRGDHDEIRKTCSDSLKISRRQDDKLAIMYGLWILGCGMSGEGLHERAARLWGAAEIVQEQNDMPPAPIAMDLNGYEDRLARTRAALGKEAMETEWQRGRTMTQDEAIDYALAGETPDKTLLTPREIEVAKLLEQSLTNPQISQQLTISERTVHNHVSKVLKKLGLGSRAEVAGWLRQDNR